MKTLPEIVQELKNDKKVQLIYAFNGQGKTRLSREFKKSLEVTDDDGEELMTVIYYNAFTEDLFRWNNSDIKLEITPNGFTNIVLKEQGQEDNITKHFQRYINSTVTPKFNAKFSEITFPISDNNGNFENIKISKGEESNFIWCIFYSLFEIAIENLNIDESSDRSTDLFNHLEYVFIDDPVTSLDDNHLIQLAVDLAALIKKSESNLKFIITTHNPLFYNVLYNELQKNRIAYTFIKSESNEFELNPQSTDSPFSYHIFLIKEIKNAIANNTVKKYHFNLLRNILEKTATFLGHTKWGYLLPQDQEGGENLYERRVLNLSSHSAHATEETHILTPQDTKTLQLLLNHLIDNYGFWKEDNNDQQ